MRKHPLIALIAFTFVAASIFIGTAGASSINAVPVRATSHLAKGGSALDGCSHGQSQMAGGDGTRAAHMLRRSSRPCYHRTR